MGTFDLIGHQRQALCADPVHVLRTRDEPTHLHLRTALVQGETRDDAHNVGLVDRHPVTPLKRKRDGRRFLIRHFRWLDRVKRVLPKALASIADKEKTVSLPLSFPLLGS
mgnify:CR=1 FL=1